MANSSENITQKKLRFAHEVFRNGGNRAAAARAVGYSDKVAKQMGSRLYKDAVVQEELQKLKRDFNLTSTLTDEEKEEMKKTVAGIKETLERLTRILRREEPEDNIVVLKTETADFEDGRKTTEHSEHVEIVQTKTRNSDLLKAADLLLKYYYRDEDKEQTQTRTAGGILILPEVN